MLDNSIHALGISRYKRLESLRAQLDQDRQSYMSHWRELADYILPRRARFTISDSANRGNIRNTNIIDSTATFSARTLASGMMSGLTSPARPWFRLTVTDPNLAEDEAVKEWLHEVWRGMNTVFTLSNLYKELPTLYLDTGVFATGAMGIYEHPDTVIRCETYPIGSYMLGLDAERKVRVFMRELTMTVRQVVQKWGPKEKDNEGKMVWGDSKLSDRVKTAWDNQRYEDKVEIVHAVFPNELYNGILKLSKFKKFAQVYYEKGHQDGHKEILLEETGYDDFPIVAMRWHVDGENAYGIDSPGMLALGDIKSLQLGMKRGAQAIDKLVTPPLVGPSSLRTVAVNSLPGGITYLDQLNPNASLKPLYEVRPDLNALQMWLEGFKYNIRRAFFEDLFLLLGSNPALDQVQRTAREIEERHEEKFLALGPVVEQGSDDVLDPLIDRVFNIMVRQGKIPPPPPELEGQNIKVEYISVMAQSQKLLGVGGVERFSQFASNVATIVPSVLDKIDTDQLMDEYAEMTGIPPKIVRSDDEVAGLRQARAQQEAAAQNAQTMETASKAAKNLSQTPTTGDTALTALMAAVGGQGVEAPVAA